ncbi:phage tail protein [Streptomyces sp. NPDC002596]|uniref:phage tail protein n=1 Tax=unclassified Streptomyces TaxID=2593676 RepID=UPI00224F8ADA|nr:MULTISPECIES: phage tail protein [unclassified Streptomyces]MCX4533834.1 phage tail protein [Streptomyces sp. NBC_01669]WSA00774.1 phage tail protein [Streptomyces sp. NBC_00841]
MRTAVTGLPTPHPLIEQLPAVYLEQDFLQRFLAALDDVLAPVLLTIDNLPAHLDPRSAPDDFLAWLAQWVAVEPHEDSPLEQRRATVRGAVSGHSRRGTLRGLADAVRLETGIEPEIVESGGTAWSTRPNTALPGQAGPWVTVRLRVPDPDRVDRVRLQELIGAEVPAHVGRTVEILPSAPQPGGTETGGAA